MTQKKKHWMGLMKKMVWKYWLLVVASLMVTFVVALWVGSEQHEEHNVFLELNVEQGLFYRAGSQFAINSDFPQAVSFSYTKPFSELKSYPYIHFKEAVIGPFDDVRLEIKSGQKVLDNVLHVNGSGLIYKVNWNKELFKPQAPIELKFNVVYGSDLGMRPPERKDITFNGLYLQTDSLASRWQYLASWFNHQPAYHLSSMNFWQKQGLPVIFAIAFIMWLTFVMLVFWLWRVPFKQLLLLLLFLTVPVFVSVIDKQLNLKTQIKRIFDKQPSNTSINLVDQNIKSLASAFHQTMSNHPRFSQFGTNLAVVVQINQAFEQSRMMYHLSHWNVFRAVNWNELSLLKQRKQLTDIFVIYSQSNAPQCQADVLKESDDAELLLSQNGYCVVKL